MMIQVTKQNTTKNQNHFEKFPRKVDNITRGIVVKQHPHISLTANRWKECVIASLLYFFNSAAAYRI